MKKYESVLEVLMARRRRRGLGSGHPSNGIPPWRSRSPAKERSLSKERSPARATNPRKAKSLADAEMEKRQLAEHLLEGEEFKGDDGYRYVVLSKYCDGSSTVRRSDGQLASLKRGDKVPVSTRESPARSWVL